MLGREYAHAVPPNFIRTQTGSDLRYLHYRGSNRPNLLANGHYGYLGSVGCTAVIFGDVD